MEHIETAAGGWNPSGNEHFTGTVWNRRLKESEDGITMIAVQFAPGARSDWHSHPGGQLLYVVSGTGLVQTENQSTISISPGDVVYAPPGERHWHGASPDSPMQHLSLTTGGPAAWEDKVSDDEYGRR
ncbi:MAG TPA: cupin domain-containing protein [Acidimicrobiia bacterium]|nr:cupin domain-containing protein [Acidimicrobiia bacterium]